jgi:hypothetical protein
MLDCAFDCLVDQNSLPAILVDDDEIGFQQAIGTLACRPAPASR